MKIVIIVTCSKSSGVFSGTVREASLVFNFQINLYNISAKMRHGFTENEMFVERQMVQLNCLSLTWVLSSPGLLLAA